MDQIVTNQFCFRFILIEINDLDLNVDSLSKFISELAEQLVLSSFHTNNFAAISSGGFPSAFGLISLRDPEIRVP